jgi:hypothetical protein
MKTLFLLISASLAAYAQTSPLEDLIEAARGGPATPGLKDRIVKTLGAHGGQNVWGQDYIFVADSPTPVTVSIDQLPALPWRRSKGLRSGCFSKRCIRA